MTKLSLLEAADACDRLQKTVYAIASQLWDCRSDLPRKKGCRGIGHFSSAHHHLFRAAKEFGQAKIEYWDAENPNWAQDLFDSASGAEEPA